MVLADSPSTRLATRLAFAVAGFGISCWAPLVPFAKIRIGADEALLGGLLLCLGIGSVPAMLVTGAMSSRFAFAPRGQMDWPLPHLRKMALRSYDNQVARVVAKLLLSRNGAARMEAVA